MKVVSKGSIGNSKEWWPSFSFSLRNLSNLRASAVNHEFNTLTAETPSTQRKRRGLKVEQTAPLTNTN
jgi:hypothetical protein